MTTKLYENTSVNLLIPGYLFVHANSKSNEGGVFLYISNQLVFCRRRDADISSDGIEFCWIEITQKAASLVIPTSSMCVPFK